MLYHFEPQIKELSMPKQKKWSSGKELSQFEIDNFGHIFLNEEGPIHRTRRPHSSTLEWIPVNLNDERLVDVYMFEDVLNELIFCAKQERSIALLTGEFFSDPSDYDPKFYIEISGYRNLFPCTSAMDYAMYLKNNMSILSEQRRRSRILGVCHLLPERCELTLEDVVLQRTFFPAPFTVAFRVASDETSPQCLEIDGEGDMYEIGFTILRPGVPAESSGV